MTTPIYRKPETSWSRFIRRANYVGAVVLILVLAFALFVIAST